MGLWLDGRRTGLPGVMIDREDIVHFTTGVDENGFTTEPYGRPYDRCGY